jgi:enoyl-CoA hydratase
MELAEQLAAFPQACLREDRLSLYDQPGLDLAAAMAAEWEHGMRSLSSGSLAGAARFTSGEGRHGTFSG